MKRRDMIKATVSAGAGLAVSGTIAQAVQANSAEPGYDFSGATHIEMQDVYGNMYMVDVAAIKRVGVREIHVKHTDREETPMVLIDDIFFPHSSLADARAAADAIIACRRERLLKSGCSIKGHQRL